MIALGVALPLTVHAAVVSRNTPLTIASLALLALIVMLPRLMRLSAAAWCAVPLIVAALVLLWRAHAEWLPLYATPVLVSFVFAWVFGHTLAPGEVPLIERLVRLLHENDDLRPDIRAYARGCTLAWTLLLTTLGVLNLTLALIAAPNGVLLLLGIRPPFTVPVEVWSLFAYFLNYVFVGVFFLLEYLYRDRRFPEQKYRNVFDFMRRAAAVGPRLLRARND
ncbi:MAG TPA: hypothetical protein VFS52_08775 [Steroidobacteraceae bacterium]|jgi:uncharacterized membrane protein|nr:hypothetical protein [Steroidobacteraceae bacterium]